MDDSNSAAEEASHGRLYDSQIGLPWVRPTISVTGTGQILRRDPLSLDQLYHLTFHMARVGAHAAIDANDATAVSVFKQGVEAYNAKNSASLVFVSVESATKQVVSGFNFKGIINVTDGGAAVKYQVTVWQKAGGQSIEVTEFTKL
jgi:hypothetical protein